MKILLLGSGGREHALALKLRASSALVLVSAPGSDALAELGMCVPLDLENPASMAAWCAANRPDLVVVGPEVPLVAGVADAVRALHARNARELNDGILETVRRFAGPVPLRDDLTLVTVKRV